MEHIHYVYGVLNALFLIYIVNLDHVTCIESQILSKTFIKLFPQVLLVIEKRRYDIWQQFMT